MAGLVISILIVALVNFAGSAEKSRVNSDPPAERGRVILVVVDCITWDDFLKSNNPVMKKLASTGVAGLMTTNPAGGSPRVPENTYATIGAGAKVAGGPSGGLAFNAFEKYELDTAGDAYFRSTGQKASSEQVVHLGIAEMEKANLRLKYRYSLGAIGTILHQNGLKTAVIGNADMPGAHLAEESCCRQAVNIAMDNRGLVDYGNILPGTYQFNPVNLAGVKTDYRVLLNEFDVLRDKADFIVFETGDTSRIEKKAPSATDEVLRNQKLRALAKIDGFLGELLKRIDLAEDLLMVVVPTPANDAMVQGNFLTPFIMAGRDVGKGVAWSGSIKRNGLIANIDIASEILRYFGVPSVIRGDKTQKDIILGGQVIEGRISASPFDEITKLGQDTVFLNNARYPLVKTYINTSLVIVILGLAAAAWRVKQGRYLVPILTALTTVPGILLWGNFLPRPSTTVVAIEIFGLTVLFTLVVMIWGRKSPLSPFAITTGITVLMIVGDILLGAPLGKTSPFSYDVMSGARFYGIGNEYMGVLLGCAIVFTGLAMDWCKISLQTKKVLSALLFVTITYVLAAPNLGTNVGGAIAAVAGFGASGLILFNRKINKKAVLAIPAVIALVIAGFVIYDLTRAVEVQSHIGRTVTLIRENGLAEVANIVSRKWAMNYKLIKGTSWSWFYFLSLFTILFLSRRLPGEMKRFREIYPWFNKLLPGVIIASIFALIFNDSGVVAAATMIVYAVAPFLTGLMMIEGERPLSKEDPIWELIGRYKDKEGRKD